MVRFDTRWHTNPLSRPNVPPKHAPRVVLRAARAVTSLKAGKGDSGVMMASVRGSGRVARTKRCVHAYMRCRH